MWIPEVPGSLTGKDINNLHLQGSHCDTCGRTFFPARKNCPKCMDNKPITSMMLSDLGTLQTYAVASVAPPGYEVPHAQGYIDLDDQGPRIFALLSDIGDGSGLKTGDRMILKVVERGMDPENRKIMGYRFRPLASVGLKSK